MAGTSYWERYQRARLSRRRLLATAGVGGAGLVIASACGGGGSSGGDKSPAAAIGTRPAAGEPKSGGRFKGVVQGDWGTIDPMVTVGNATGIIPRMYNALINRSNADPSVVFMDLAEKMEQVDEQTYVFTLRPGVKIAPNSFGVPEREMDSSDCQVWYERCRADKTVIARAFTEPSLASADAPDARTFRMITKGSYAYFVSRIGRALGGTIPPKEFWQQGISLKDQGIGAGPFIVRPGSFVESGGVILDRNPNYYRKDDQHGNNQLPYIDGIDVVRVTERQARRTAFLDKQIYNYGTETVDEANELLKQRGSDIYVNKDPSFTFISFTMNPSRKPWDDDRIRKAALYALDRKQFVDLIVGEGEGKPDGLVHWPVGPYALSDDELQQYQPYDPKRSHDLIKAATGEDSVKVKITYPNTDIEFHDRHLPIFLRQIRDAGFDVEEDPRDFGQWLGNYTSVDYDASLSPNQIYETAEIPMDWHSVDGPAGQGSFAKGIGNLYPEVQAAIMDSKQATSLEEHIQKVKDAQKVIYDHGPGFLPIISWYTYTLYWNFVKNTPQGLGDTGTFLNNWWLEL